MHALGQSARLPASLTLARLLAHGWADQRARPRPAWPSDITDDHTPFEFSLAIDGSAEVVRILTEPQDPRDPTLLGSWRAAQDVHEMLAGRFGASFAQHGEITDLFAPTASSRARFGVWHSAILDGAHSPHFKLYLNPAIHGREDAPALLGAALARLGLARTWADFARATFRRGALDAPVYLSLDLLDTPDARVKIYMAHDGATSRDVVRALGGSAGFEPALVQTWCRALLGGDGPYDARPPITCFALRPGNVELHSTTLHLPVRCYLPDDFEVARRISRLLGLPQRVRYMRALTALSDRPLEAGRGLQTYASLRASPEKEAVTVYLAPQVYSAALAPDEDDSATFFRRVRSPGAACCVSGAPTLDSNLPTQEPA
jgi:DMATS type aromatic prenyltransferase